MHCRMGAGLRSQTEANSGPLVQLLREKAVAAGVQGAEIRINLQKCLLGIHHGEQGSGVLTFPEQAMRCLLNLLRNITVFQAQICLPRKGGFILYVDMVDQKILHSLRTYESYAFVHLCRGE